MAGTKAALVARRCHQRLFPGEAAKIQAAVTQARAQAPRGTIQMAFVATGGLGDFLVIARFVRDLLSLAGSAQFDVFSPAPAVAALAFCKLPGFRATYQESSADRAFGAYDLVLRTSQYVAVYRDQADLPAMRHCPDLVKAIAAVQRFAPRINDLIQNHPYRDHELAQLAVEDGTARRDFLHHMADLPYGGDRLSVSTDDAVCDCA